MVSEHRFCDNGQALRQKALRSGFSEHQLKAIEQSIAAAFERSTALCIKEMNKVFDSYTRRSEARRLAGGGHVQSGQVAGQADSSAPQSGFVWDEASGYYYDAPSGFYYDGNTGLYYDGNSSSFLPIQNSEALNGSSESNGLDDENAMRVAKNFDNEMENWSATNETEGSESDAVGSEPEFVGEAAAEMVKSPDVVDGGCVVIASEGGESYLATEEEGAEQVDCEVVVADGGTAPISVGSPVNKEGDEPVIGIEHEMKMEEDIEPVVDAKLKTDVTGSDLQAEKEYSPVVGTEMEVVNRDGLNPRMIDPGTVSLGGKDSVLIPVAFEGDLAGVVSHVKENDCVLVSGQLSSELRQFASIGDLGKLHVAGENLNFVEGYSNDVSGGDCGVADEGIKDDSMNQDSISDSCIPQVIDGTTEVDNYVPDVGNVEQTWTLVASLEAGSRFSKCISSIMPTLVQLMASSSLSDVENTVLLLMRCRQFQIEGSEDCLRKMLPLVFSQDKSIYEAVENAFITIYVRKNPVETAKNLMSLAIDSNIGDLAALEFILGALVSKGDIIASMLSALWDFFCFNIGGTTAQQSRGALAVLCMAAKSSPSILSSHLQDIVDIGFGRWAKVEPLLPRTACLALQRLSEDDKKKLLSTNGNRVFGILEYLISSFSIPENIWYAAADRAIASLYIIHPTPEAMAADLVKKSLKSVFDSTEGSDLQADRDSGSPNALTYVQVAKLSRYLFVVSQVAMNQLLYIESTPGRYNGLAVMAVVVLIFPFAPLGNDSELFCGIAAKVL